MLAKNVLVLWLTNLCFVGIVSAESSLPAEHEAARLMLAIEASIEAENWPKAEQQLNSLQQLGVELPADFHYFKGVWLAEVDRVDLAQASLENYVILAGKAGEFYVSALERLTSIETDKHEVVQQVEKTATISAVNKEQSSDGYIKSLQALYLTDDPVKALVMQVNSLLSSHAYTGSRLKKAGSRKGLHYQISVSGTDIVLQEKRYISGAPELRVNKLAVAGIDPFLKTACSGSELKCWIYHPGNGHQYWITIDRDEMVLSELAGAISKLIRLLQQ